MSSRRLPETTAYVRVTGQSWQKGTIEGEVTAGNFEWQFQWRFTSEKTLILEPSQGRALIQEPLHRFLEKWDYQLEPGGDYSFTVRAEF
ncbi:MULTISPECIES: DUF3146 family protein [unclassified Microcoleus]|uniref:DUF3146 family protein n=1 Tax=unclassified Microcoleus TaxID=2642155 RepID=UPI0027733A1C|nr:DUF3146 family protein [Cyanobacteriota bacterium]